MVYRIAVAFAVVLCTAYFVVSRKDISVEQRFADSQNSSVSGQISDDLTNRGLEPSSMERLRAAPAREPHVKASLSETSQLAGIPATEEYSGQYDFDAISDGNRLTFDALDRILQAEPVDRSWAPKTADTLGVLLASMPARSLVGDLRLTCKSTLCRVEVTGDSAQLMNIGPDGNNIQSALINQLAQPAARELFDNQMVFVNYDPPSGTASVSVFTHRREAKKEPASSP